MESPSRLVSSFLKSQVWLTLTLLVIAAFPQLILAQSNFGRTDAEYVLEIIKVDIKKNYYDPEFHGIDLEARFKTAKDKLKTASSGSQMMAIIAQVLLDFDDSHLFFLPPGRSNQTDYGWEMKAVGEDVFISTVKPSSDADAKGLREGDRVISVGGFQPARDNLWKIQYLFNSISPKLSLHLEVRSPDGKERAVDVAARVRQGRQVMDLTGRDITDYKIKVDQAERMKRSRSVNAGTDVLVWKLPSFAVDKSEIDAMIGRARKYKSLVLDLRGNGGGYVDTCERLVGSFFDKEINMAERKGRKKMKPMKSDRVSDPYHGKLAVLIDSESASAAEVFARVIQIEKRGIVLGDRSAGAVMEAVTYPHELGLNNVIPYAVEVTDADLIMADGKSLEKTGVTPDELLLPSPADMLAGKDPVLARATGLLGVPLTPEQAGKLFPIE